MKKGKKTPAEVKEAAKALLADDKKFDQVFEKIFKKCDKNFDKKIDDSEYFNFLNQMLTDFGLKPLNFGEVKAEFKKADGNKDGTITKEEFKNELKKKLEFYSKDEEE